ncbi:MAG TPA: hypothetical protein VEO02_09535, partial [Thermoanaerobaculia bacterium]|nr:hypothetical protein [Thermoanaerobaculia bacterium]
GALTRRSVLRERRGSAAGGQLGQRAGGPRPTASSLTPRCAPAARQGTTVTSFIEDALRLKLRLAGAPRKPEEIELPTFAAGKGFPFPPKALKKLARRSEREHDTSKHLALRRKAR